MSNCDVCITDNFDGGKVEMPVLSTPQCKSGTKCNECGREITRGERYERFAGKFEGAFFVERTCLVCAEVRKVFYCGGGWSSGLLWEDMRDQAFDHLTTSSECFVKLSAAAKSRVMDEWRAWKGL